LSILKKYNISVPPGIISYLKSAPDGGLGNLRKFADQDSRGIPGESSNDKVCENLSDSAHQSSKDKIHGHSSDPAHKNSKNMIYEIISDNALFIETAAGLLEEKSGAKVYIRPGFMSGEEGGAAHFIDSLREIKKEYSKDFIFIAGGEIPVAAENKTGRGGRCQHFALEAMMRLKRDNLYGFKKITLAAFATDGLEAFTDAAGAVFDESDIRAASLDEIESSLRAADSYAYFQKNGGLIITGATGLNVNDAFMAFCF
jgi:glycerate-2-kinase